MMGDYYGGWHSFGFGGVFMIFFWILIVWFVFALIKKFSGPSCCGKDHKIDAPSADQEKISGALEILKERYAKGEINKEDFEKIKKDLG